jgi:hypothetical protein
MKTVKELQQELPYTVPQENELKQAYVDWYETAITWILEDIESSMAISVEGIEKYLSDLLK